MLRELNLFLIQHDKSAQVSFHQNICRYFILSAFNSCLNVAISDDFDFDKVIFHFLNGDILRSTFYGVYSSQLIPLLECLFMLLTAM